MILAVDVDYRNDKASIAGICFHAWSDESPKDVLHSEVDTVLDYEPGQFYKRELPCILKLLKEHELRPDLIVIDGFVYLGQDSKPGLGVHLFNALGKNTPVIGVAKSAFKGSSPKTEVFRGKSEKPLYVTAIGIEQQVANANISSMHGKYRIPTLLKLVDHECRKS